MATAKHGAEVVIDLLPSIVVTDEQRVAINEAIYTIAEGTGVEIGYSRVLLGWQIVQAALDGTLELYLEEYMM